MMQEWEQNFAAAVDSLQNLQPVTGLTQRPDLRSGSQTQRCKRLTMILDQVPSAPLAALISPDSQQGVLPGDLAQAQDEYIVLQEVVHACKALLSSMHKLHHQGMQRMQQAASAPDSWPEDPSCLVFDVEELQPQAPSAQHTATPTAGNLSGPAPSLSEVTTGDAVVPQTAGGRADPGPHELLLLAGALMDGYEKQLGMLALIASSLNLASPTEHVSTYVTLLQLQPFVDERVVSLLIQVSKRS
eukprot:CAMPEP_0119104094 /NCGR_PEP_ID=MMETSP1180-20130426/2402_1 /TAXON_ID=3052 ORGANISM="Chlamydomonas cf sp, Strain CCMP681" /NCGR_SAMPLE_ID=MMETSP1180 /ASSEMBLY_ACC=CAM_ASM_000741 /LENGTH=243 /DNA_ID=CAMNT_0007088767 /DNA_START=104 /DNA_END=835 /DNA_ORIENTATION=-